MPDKVTVFTSSALAEAIADELLHSPLGVIADSLPQFDVPTTVEELANRVKICERFAEAEAHAMLWLIIRNAETVCYLAQIDLALFPGAISAARTCFEVGVRGLWMLQPKTAEEREGICEVLVHGVGKETNDLCRALGGLGLFHSEVSAPLVVMCRSRLTEAGE